MIEDFVQAFIDTPILPGQDYKMDNAVVCLGQNNLVYDIRFLKSAIPVQEQAYAVSDIYTLFEKALEKAVSCIIFYSCEYIYTSAGQSFKLNFQFEEMRFYQKKKVYFASVQNKNSRLYDEVSTHIKACGKSGCTLSELGYKFFRNHRNRQQYVMNKLEESGEFIMTKQAGDYRKPRTVFIALENIGE